MIKHIFKREVTALFRTPFAWVLLSVTSSFIAYQFLSQIEIFIEYGDKLRQLDEPPGVSQLVVAPTIGLCGLTLLFLVPLVTMHSIAGERRHGTMSLLFSSPVKEYSIILGKFMGLFFLFITLWIIVATMILSLLWGTPLDLGLCASGIFGLMLLTATTLAIGLLISCLFSQASAAGAATLGVLLLLWFCDWAGRSGVDENIFSYLSMMNHFQNVAGGLFDTSDIAYFFILTVACLALASWRLGDLRVGG